MITILHNPRCSKSREALLLLENYGKEFEIIKYLESQITEDQLKQIVSLLHIKPIDLVRKNETIWKSEFKNIRLSDDDIIKTMIKHPQLIERPIVINGKKAAIGRPAQNILNIL